MFKCITYSKNIYVYAYNCIHFHSRKKKKENLIRKISKIKRILFTEIREKITKYLFK